MIRNPGSDRIEPPTFIRRRRRSWARRLLALLAVAILFGLFAGWGLWFALHSVPEFYTELLEIHSDELGDELERHSLEARNAIHRGDNWSLEISQDQLNAWLAQDLPRKFPGLLPPDIRDPRVLIAADAIQVGLIHETSSGNLVVSIELQPMLTEEPNEVAIRVLRVRAGRIPLPLPSLLDPIADTAARSGYFLRWTDTRGTPVALLRFPEQHADMGAHRFHVDSLELAPGKLLLRGRTLAAAEN